MGSRKAADNKKNECSKHPPILTLEDLHVADGLDLVPEARFSFDNTLTLNFGWISPLGTAANRAVSYWGEILIRVEYSR